jgi:hypothetical protein
MTFSIHENGFALTMIHQSLEFNHVEVSDMEQRKALNEECRNGFALVITPADIQSG